MVGEGLTVGSCVCTGRIPLDPRLAECLEEGRSFVDAFTGSAAQKAMEDIVQRLTGSHIRDHADGGTGDMAGHNVEYCVQ